MKKIFLSFFCILLTTVSYAKTYDELMHEAEQYENKKEWFYALGAYHNAINISKEDTNSAKQKYIELSECIKSGKPGYGDFNVFSMHDEWVNLIKNAEKYFTENFPYTIIYNTLEMDSVNYEKKTANYKLGLTVKQSDFYKNALEILKSGYENTNHSDWKDLESNYKSLWFISDDFAMLLHSNWDGSLTSSLDFYRKSVYSTKQEKINKVSEYPVLQKEANSVYQKDKIALSYLSAPIVPLYKSLSRISGISVCEVPAFAACFSETMTTYNGHDYSVPLAVPYYEAGKQTCYDLKLGVYDENDNLIIEGTRQTICKDNFSYLFTGVPQDKLSIFDSKKCTIKLIGIWLNYGVYDISLMTDDDFKNNTIRGIVKPLPDIKIESENVEFLDRTVLEEQERIAKEEIQKKQSEKLASEKANWESFIEKMEGTYKQYQQQAESIDLILEQIGDKIGVKFKKYDKSNQSDRRYNGCYVESVDKKTPAAKGKITSNCRLVEINDKGLWEIARITESNTEKLYQFEKLIKKAKDLSQDYYQNNDISKYEKDKFENMKNEISNSYSNLPQLEIIESFDSGTELIFSKMIEIGSYKTIKIIIP